MFCVVSFVLVVRLCFFFFFKQKTAYEMRMSDWSSDVCSSDLGHVRRGRLLLLVEDPRHLRPEVAQPLLLQYQARPHHPGTGPPAAEVVRGWLGTGEDAELQIGRAHV